MLFAEDFLHYLWKLRLFNQLDLKTTAGEIIEILSPGIHNKHAGPDFENAKIRIGETLWAGNVEIHLNSSDWLRHNHQQDEAYANVILHVVNQHDKPVLRSNGIEIPTLELKDLIPTQIAFNYEQLMQGLNWIPCEKQIAHADNFIVKSWLSRVLVERLEEKSGLVNTALKEYKGSWDDAFYINLARNFGFKVNALPFELLARSLPQTLLAKHKNNALQIEALIFGQAGFLTDDVTDDYTKQLQKEYQFLNKKYKLTRVDRYLWKYLRLRPQNFPTMRLAQFSALVLKSNHLFSKILEIKDIKQIKLLFSDLPINSYWNNHYRFDTESKNATSQLGEESINNILINTVSLFLFAFGKNTGNSTYVNRAIALQEYLPAENNQIINKFKELGVEAEKALSSQALLQLKKNYCDQKKCLHCGIGIKILNQK